MRRLECREHNENQFWYIFSFFFPLPHLHDYTTKCLRLSFFFPALPSKRCCCLLQMYLFEAVKFAKRRYEKKRVWFSFFAFIFRPFLFVLSLFGFPLAINHRLPFRIVCTKSIVSESRLRYPFHWLVHVFTILAFSLDYEQWWESTTRQFNGPIERLNIESPYIRLNCIIFTRYDQRCLAFVNHHYLSNIEHFHAAVQLFFRIISHHRHYPPPSSSSSPVVGLLEAEWEREKKKLFSPDFFSFPSFELLLYLFFLVEWCGMVWCVVPWWRVCACLPTSTSSSPRV